MSMYWDLNLKTKPFCHNFKLNKMSNGVWTKVCSPLPRSRDCPPGLQARTRACAMLHLPIGHRLMVCSAFVTLRWAVQRTIPSATARAPKRPEGAIRRGEPSSGAQLTLDDCRKRPTCCPGCSSVGFAALTCLKLAARVLSRISMPALRAKTTRSRATARGE